MSREKLTHNHSIVNSVLFRLKSTLLIGKRFLENVLSPVKKFKKEPGLKDKSIIAISETELWNSVDNKENWILTAGKIENLRIAGRKLNGLEVKANAVFSFWKHIGQPNRTKGYVVGREIREGCIVPTIAGGLCQISNALYDAALKANFDIIERHKHTQVIPGSLAEQDRDATVKWNYVDLRFKSDFDFKIEVELSENKLIVIFRGERKNTKTEDNNIYLRNSHKLNDCFSCGSINCFNKKNKTEGPKHISLTTFILDEKWPEFDDYVKAIAKTSDYFVFSLNRNNLLNSSRYDWSIDSNSYNNIRSTAKEGIYRALRIRFFTKNKNNVFKLNLELDRKIARKAARFIPLQSTHIIISQNLLPFVFEAGVLGGRTFDVLMTRLPMEKLHQRLDFAYSKHRESLTLNDFRANQYFIDLENQALTKARKVVTPHSEIADIFNNKTEKLSWKIPVKENISLKGNKILFPASAVARKGAYEIRELAKDINLKLIVSGTAIEKENFWEDLVIEKFDGDFSKINLVIYPTYVEHQPRLLLKAISKGILIITTKACGLEKVDNIKFTEIGNYEQLKNEVQFFLKTYKSSL